MRIIVPHTKNVETAKLDVERAIQKLTTIHVPAVEFAGLETRWTGETLNFTLTAAVGPIRSPICGAAIVTEKDITVDIALPNILTALMSEPMIETKVRGLLRS